MAVNNMVNHYENNNGEPVERDEVQEVRADGDEVEEEVMFSGAEDEAEG